MIKSVYRDPSKIYCNIHIILYQQQKGKRTATSFLIQGNDFVNSLFGSESAALALLDLLGIAAAITDKVGEVKHLGYGVSHTAGRYSCVCLIWSIEDLNERGVGNGISDQGANNVFG